MILCIQSLLDADIKPLSPTDEHIINYATRHGYRVENDISHRDSRPQPVLVPAYFSLPGAVEEEVTFDTWRKQQQQQKNNVPHTQQQIHSHYTLPSSYHYHQASISDAQTGGASTPSGCSETESEFHSWATEDLALSVSSPPPKPCTQQAWDSQTQLSVRENVEDDRIVLTPSETPSRVTCVKDTQKEKIIDDW